MPRCPVHKIDMECMGGRSAHASNWYCPECEQTADSHARERDQEIANRERTTLAATKEH